MGETATEVLPAPPPLPAAPAVETALPLVDGQPDVIPPAAEQELTAVEITDLEQFQANEAGYQAQLIGAQETLTNALDKGWQPTAASEAGEPSAQDGARAALAQKQKTAGRGEAGLFRDENQDQTYKVYIEGEDGQEQLVSGEVNYKDTLAALREIQNSDSLEAEVKEKAKVQADAIETRIDQIKLLKQALSELDLQGRNDEAADIFNQIAAGTLDPLAAGKQLQELGIKTKDQLPQKGEALSAELTQMYQTALANNSALKERGIDTPEQLNAAILALTDPKKREEEQKKGDKLSWFLMALYYVLVGVGATAEATAKMATDQAPQR